MSSNSGPSDTVNLLTFTIYWVLVGISVFQLLALMKFVIVDETLRENLTLTKKTVATPFNLLLMLMTFSNTCLYIGVACEIYADNEQTYRMGLLGNIVGAMLTQLVYVAYTWIRGEPIIEVAFPSAVPYMRLSVKLFPFLYIASSLPIVLSFFGLPMDILLQAQNYLQIVCGLCTVLFDTIIVTVFTRYLKFLSTSRESGVAIVDEKLKIIARYGLASSALVLFTLCLFALSIGISDANISVILIQIVFGFFSVLWTILFSMKRALYFLKSRKKSMASAINTINRDTSHDMGKKGQR